MHERWQWDCGSARAAGSPHLARLHNRPRRDSYMSFVDEVLPVPIVHGYGSRIASNSFEAGLGFTVTLGLKVRV